MKRKGRRLGLFIGGVVFGLVRGIFLKINIKEQPL